MLPGDVTLSTNLTGFITVQSGEHKSSGITIGEELDSKAIYGGWEVAERTGWQ